MNNPVKRLVVIAGTAPAPAETFIARDLEALQRYGWQITSFGLNQRFKGCDTMPRRCGFAAVTRELLGRVWRLRLHPRQALSLLLSWRLINAVAAAARDANVIFAQFAWLTADIASVAAQVTGKPWVCAVHAWDVFAQPPSAVRVHLAGAAQIVACSTAAENAVVAAGISAGIVVRINHGLPLTEYPFRATQPALSQVILAVGRLEPKKGFDVLLRAFACISESRQLQLHFIGEGRQRATLEELTAALGLKERVVFHGGLVPAAVRQQMQTAALLALPSLRLKSGDRDGIANVLVEAMALGVPVVTTRAGAAEELVCDRQNGLLVPAADEQALAKTIEALLADLPLREQLARAGRATVEAHFDARRTSSALSAVLASHVSVLASNSSRQAAP